MEQNTSSAWTRIVRVSVFASLLCSSALFAACAPPEDESEELVAASAESALSFSGTANATNASWKTFDFQAKTGDSITATLDWDNAAANLNVYIYDPAGTVVAYSNKNAKPEKASTVAKATGTWRVAMKCGSGSAKYTIQVDVKPGTVTPPAGPRFYGDPGKGKIYLGAAVTSQAPNALDPIEADTNGKKFGLIRLYYADSISWSNVDGHLAKGRIPALSFKNGDRSMSSIASGGQDAWIDAIGAEIKKRAPAPFYMTFFHEPEDNFPAAADAATFRAASRRIVSRWRSAGVKNFTYVSDYYMTNWTFSAASGRDWRFWYPDWKGTTAAGSSKDAPNIADFYTGTDSVVDVIGFDIYNWWEPGQPVTSWKTFQSHADFGVSRTKLLGKPFCVGEMGVMAYQQNNVYDAARTKAWLTDAYTYMTNNDFVCAMYWSNDLKVDGYDPRLTTNDPQKLRLGGLADIMGRSATVTPKW